MNNLLKDAINEPNNVTKGEKFESFFENFMGQQEGLLYIDKHCRSKVGEIDYFYRNTLCGHPLWEMYPYLFIECKNWKETISSEKMNHFISLVKAKTPFPCCGIYITTSSFSPQALTTMRDARLKENVFIIPIEKNDMSELIDRGFKDSIQEKCDKLLAKA
jgi:hypothetical protein